MFRNIRYALAFLVFVSAFISLRADYIVAGPDTTLAPSSDVWAWDQSQLAPLRSALEDPANFGLGGVVPAAVTTVSLGAINPAVLAGVNAFVSPWWHDVDSAAYQADLLAFFFGGGDLFLLQDDNLVDGLGTLLGVTSFNSSGSISTAGPGGTLLFDGPFGMVAGVTQAGSQGQLNITAAGARIGSVNAEGEITTAFWLPGEYSPGAGALFILGDVDMLSGPNGGAVFPPDSGANDKGRFGLNLFALAATQDETTIPQVPEPGTIVLLASGLLLLVLRRKTRSAKPPQRP
jgi:hypothetical protein